MKLDAVLKELVDLYKQTTPFEKELSYSAQALDIFSPILSGELLYYYQHLSFTEQCYFNNSYFNLALLPFGSKRTTVEARALQDYESFVNQDYLIFAATDIDDILFCDLTDAKSPVYAGSPGDPNFYRMSDSLTEFLEFYNAYTKVEQQIEFDDVNHYYAETGQLIEQYISENSQETAKDFLLR